MGSTINIADILKLLHDLRPLYSEQDGNHTKGHSCTIGETDKFDPIKHFNQTPLYNCQL